MSGLGVGVEGVGRVLFRCSSSSSRSSSSSSSSGGSSSRVD